MKRLFALVGIALMCTACSRPMEHAYNYVKSGNTDAQSIQDKRAMYAVAGVSKVIMENDGDKTRLQVFVRDGSEETVIARAEELGYQRIK